MSIFSTPLPSLGSVSLCSEILSKSSSRRAIESHLREVDELLAGLLPRPDISIIELGSKSGVPQIDSYTRWERTIRLTSDNKETAQHEYVHGYFDTGFMHSDGKTFRESFLVLELKVKDIYRERRANETSWMGGDITDVELERRESVHNKELLALDAEKSLKYDFLAHNELFADFVVVLASGDRAAMSNALVAKINPEKRRQRALQMQRSFGLDPRYLLMIGSEPPTKDPYAMLNATRAYLGDLIQPSMTLQRKRDVISAVIRAFQVEITRRLRSGVDLKSITYADWNRGLIAELERQTGVRSTVSIELAYTGSFTQAPEKILRKVEAGRLKETQARH